MKTTKTKKLRSGFTTGAAAAAAAKGAILALLTNSPPQKVRITFLTGAKKDIALKKLSLESPQCAVATVIKDAGDDPDITHKAEIGVRLSLTRSDHGQKVLISGGKGVGTITKPGLEIAPGHAAINPGPLRMITNEVREILDQHNCSKSVKVEVFVPKGEELALKTLNARLGIVGGLSILGTTGIEHPMSHEAYLATIEKSLCVAKACGVDQVVLTTGRRSERFAQELWPQKPAEAFVQMGDFFKATLNRAASKAFAGIIVVVFFGKALKMAMGIPHTHALRSQLTLTQLADWTYKQSHAKKMAAEIRSANTARQAFYLLKKDHLAVIRLVAKKVHSWSGHFAELNTNIRVIILDYEGHAIAEHSG